jgi:16S rRNA processing protein RimM
MSLNKKYILLCGDIAMKEYLSIGQIINTHGVNGELKIYPLTDDIKRFRKLKKVFIDGIERNITWCKLQSDKVILKIDGIESMDQAIQYKNKYLEVKRDDAVRLPEDNYFIADLIGCTVEDEDSTYLGKVYDVLQTGSNDVYWVKDNNNEVLIPALKSIVVSIDIVSQKIVIKPLKLWT